MKKSQANTREPLEVQIRRAEIPRDLDALQVIAARASGVADGIEPWTRADFIAQLGCRCEEARAGKDCGFCDDLEVCEVCGEGATEEGDFGASALLAEHAGQPIAFATYSEAPGRIQVWEVAVVASKRRQRVGTELVRIIVSMCSEKGLRRVTVDLWETLLAGQLFLRDCGFQCVRVEKEYFQDTAHGDSYVFQYNLTEGRRC